jgi:hypothetical protein
MAEITGLLRKPLALFEERDWQELAEAYDATVLEVNDSPRYHQIFANEDGEPVLFVKGGKVEEFVQHEIRILEYIKKRVGNFPSSPFILPLKVLVTPAGRSIIILPFYGQPLSLEHFKLQEFAEAALACLQRAWELNLAQGDLKPDAFLYKPR